MHYRQGGGNNQEDLITRLFQESDKRYGDRFTQHEAELRNQKASLQAIENQVGQIAKLLSERPPHKLPSQTEQNPRAHANAITLRNRTVETSSSDPPPLPFSTPSPPIVVPGSEQIRHHPFQSRVLPLMRPRGKAQKVPPKREDRNHL